MISVVFWMLFVCHTISYASRFGINTNYQTCFTPGQDCTSKIIKVINSANSSILVQAYQFTSFQIAKALVNTKKRHVKIEIILDKLAKTINITRAHLEEDAGKSIHDEFEGFSAIDLNRAGTPLLEIVSEPEISNAKEAVAYMKAMHQLVTFLDVSDGNMAQGSLRCDANVSIRKKGDKELGTRTEIKNIAIMKNKTPFKK